MRWWPFVGWNLLGAISWATIYALLGSLFGASWQVLERWVGHAGLFLAVLVAIGAGILILRHRSWIKRQVDRYLPGALNQRQAAIGLVALASAALFTKIAEDVVNRESTRFDRAVSLWVHGFDTPALDAVMRLFTFIGSFPVIAVVTLVVLTWCWRRTDRSAFAGLVGVIAINETLNFALKHLFERSRPDLFQEIETLHSYSFPSGHAMAAAAAWGMIAVVIARLAPRMRLWIADRPLANLPWSSLGHRRAGRLCRGGDNPIRWHLVAGVLSISVLALAPSESSIIAGRTLRFETQRARKGGS